MRKILFILSCIILLAGCSNYLNDAMLSNFLQKANPVTFENDDFNFTFKYPSSDSIDYTEQTTENELLRLNYHDGLLSAFEIIVLPIENQSNDELLATTQNFNFYLAPHNIPQEVSNIILTSFNVVESTDELTENTES